VIALFLAVLNVWRRARFGSEGWFLNRNDFRLSASVFSSEDREPPASLKRFGEWGAYHIRCRHDQLEEAKRLFPEVQTIFVTGVPYEERITYSKPAF